MKRSILFYPLFAISLVLTGCCKEKPDVAPGGGSQDLAGAFSVSPTKYVYLAPGNLTEDGHGFVAHQWESGGYFCWEPRINPEGTSAEQGNIPYVEWGDSVGGGWRTLSQSEWHYILFDRRNAASKHATGTVNDVHGLLLLPDQWTLPEGCSFVAGCNGWEANVYRDSVWLRMEEAGAIFLPAAGWKYLYVLDGSGWYVRTDYGENGNYWTSSPHSSIGNESWTFQFFVDKVRTLEDASREGALTMRLARDKK